MKKLYLLFLFLFSISIVNAQKKIRVGPMMLIQIQIPIQPNDKSWANWNVMPSLQDSAKTIRIDRMVQGYAPFIPRHDAPYYSSSQVKEIQMSLEKILNPDLYFSGQEEFMKYYQGFLEKYVFQKTSEK